MHHSSPELDLGLRTPVFYASARGSLEAVRLLLEACADKNSADTSGAARSYFESCSLKLSH